MKSFFKKSLSVLLSLVLLLGAFTCAAAALNEDAVSKHKGQYKNYLLLGDSVASGYRDETTDNDSKFISLYNKTTYCRVPGSYGDIIANAIIDDKSMTAFAGPGFRTVEVRYMLEDDFAATCDDEYLFHPSQLYVYEKYGYLPGDERVRKAYQQAVADADLITLGVGGNDWGAYLGWVVADVFEEENVADKYVKMVEDVIEKNDMDISAVNKLLEIAHAAGALPALAAAIPEALDYGLGNFYKNWDIVIQDIYNLNPDVTLVVTGMSDNSLKGSYFDYPDQPATPVETEEQSEAVAALSKTIVDFIMSVGNKPMIEGAKKFGYAYVDTTGTTYVDSHPDAAGHAFIANKIIEALPDPEISTKFDDIAPGSKNYTAVEYVLLAGIMQPTSETSFAPDAPLTKSQLTAAMNVLNGANNESSAEAEVSVISLASTLFTSAAGKGFTGFFKGLSLAFEVLKDNSFKFSSSISRGDAARYFMEYANI